MFVNIHVLPCIQTRRKSTQNFDVGFKDENECIVIHFQLLRHPFSTFLKFAAIGKCEKMCEEMSDVTSSENVWGNVRCYVSRSGIYSHRRSVGMLVATFHSITAPAQLLAVFVWPYVFLSTSDKTHLSNPMR